MSRYQCPHCGAELPAKARVCPGCGSDEKTGWSQDAVSQGLDLPDDSFDYNEFIKEEFAPKETVQLRPKGLSWIWWLAGIGLLLTFLFFNFFWH